MRLQEGNMYNKLKSTIYKNSLQNHDVKDFTQSSHLKSALTAVQKQFTKICTCESYCKSTSFWRLPLQIMRSIPTEKCVVLSKGNAVSSQKSLVWFYFVFESCVFRFKATKVIFDVSVKRIHYKDRHCHCPLFQFCCISFGNSLEKF